MKIRGFELVEKYKNETDLLPVRETAHARLWLDEAHCK